MNISPNVKTNSPPRRRTDVFILIENQKMSRFPMSKVRRARSHPHFSLFFTFLGTAIFVFFLLTAARNAPAGENTPGVPAAADADYPALFTLLDSERYLDREKARITLILHAETPVTQPGLARAIREKLRHPGVSYEVQHTLTQVLKTLPAEFREAPSARNVENPVTKEAENAKIADMTQKLLSADAGARLFAQRELAELARKPETAQRTYQVMFAEILKKTGTAGDEIALLELAMRARQTWLLMPDTPENTPKMTEAQIAGWLRTVAPEMREVEIHALQQSEKEKKNVLEARNQPILAPHESPFSFQPPAPRAEAQNAENPPRFAPLRMIEPGQNLQKKPAGAVFQSDLNEKEKTQDLAHWNAVRCLEDALACQKYAPEVHRKLQELAKNERVSPDGKAVIAYLQSLSVPTIAAEFWRDRTLSSAQILEIGVPQKSGQMLSETHFENLDGTTVECVKGNYLKPGKYRLDRAIPHPQFPDAYFHLVDISSPRRQLAYPILLEESGENRWTEIVLRTLTPRLEKKECLSAAELVMLARIKPEVAVPLAGRFLAEVDADDLREMDELLQLTYSVQFRGQKITHHALLCFLVGQSGTKNDAKILLSAIRNHKSLACGESQQYAMGYVAALALAQRDPWDGVDDWLLSLLEVEEPLVFSGERMTFSDPMQLSIPLGGADKSRQMSLTQQVPTVGATAAGLWMKRHEMDPKDAGLTPLAYTLLENCGVQAFCAAPNGDLKAILKCRKSLP